MLGESGRYLGQSGRCESGRCWGKAADFWAKWPMFGLKRPMFHRLLSETKAADVQRGKAADVRILGCGQFEYGLKSSSIFFHGFVMVPPETHEGRPVHMYTICTKQDI